MDHFKKTIKDYLENRAATDPLFAVAYAKEKKNIGECVSYILNKVKASGRQGFADEEIYSMAVHYYDEDNISVDKAPACQVVVNREIKAKATTATAPAKSAKALVHNKPHNLMDSIQQSLFDHETEDKTTAEGLCPKPIAFAGDYRDAETLGF